MKSHNLAEINRLSIMMEDVEQKIKESRSMSVDLKIVYKFEPFICTHDDGTVETINELGAHEVLGLTQDEVRVPVMQAIEECLQKKLNGIKAKLKKLGVKFDDPIEMGTEPSRLRLTGPKFVPKFKVAN